MNLGNGGPVEITDKDLKAAVDEAARKILIENRDEILAWAKKLLDDRFGPYKSEPGTEN